MKIKYNVVIWLNRSCSCNISMICRWYQFRWRCFGCTRKAVGKLLSAFEQGVSMFYSGTVEMRPEVQTNKIVAWTRIKSNPSLIYVIRPLPRSSANGSSPIAITSSSARFSVALNPDLSPDLWRVARGLFPHSVSANLTFDSRKQMFGLIITLQKRRRTLMKPTYFIVSRTLRYLCTEINVNFLIRQVLTCSSAIIAEDCHRSCAQVGQDAWGHIVWVDVTKDSTKQKC